MPNEAAVSSRGHAITGLARYYDLVGAIHDADEDWKKRKMGLATEEMPREVGAVARKNVDGMFG